MSTQTQQSAPGASPLTAPKSSPQPSQPSTGPRGSGESDEQAQQSNTQRSRAGQAAITRLGAPVRTRLRIGQALVLISAVLAVAPYIALVQLGDILLRSYRVGVSPDPQQVRSAVMMLVGAYSTRLLLYFLALLITHLADLSLRDRLRRDIVDRISHAPLSWFTASTSGRIRKAVQDDTTLVHTVIAHGPVERLNAVVTPLALLVCAFWIDWRLALLAVSTLVLYVLTYSVSMRGMKE